VCFTLTTGDLYRNLSTNVWNGVFKKILKDTDDDFSIVILGSKSDNKYISDCLSGITSDRIFRVDGKLSFFDTANCLSTADGFVTMRTGTTTLATLLRGVNMPILVLLFCVDRNWDYDYYKKIFILKSNKCKCVEGDPSKCFKMYPDGIRRTMCIGELTPEEIYKSIKVDILSHVLD
jgi:ADP-heptose:LPS heptosyltransferase